MFTKQCLIKKQFKKVLIFVKILFTNEFFCKKFEVKEKYLAYLSGTLKFHNKTS